MRAVAAGQFQDAFDALVAALGDDVGGAELAAQVGAVGVPAHQDDLLGAEPLRREHAAQSDGTVTDDGDRVAGADSGGDGAVVAGAVHVGQRKQRRHQRRVRGDRKLDQRALRQRHPHRLALAGVDAWRAPPAAMTARDLQPSRQKSHVLSAHTNGATTRSPGAKPLTSVPTSSTMPMNSWPMRRPARWRASTGTATGRCRRCRRR